MKTKLALINSRFRHAIVLFFFCSISTIVNAQSWSVSKKTATMSWGALLYIESAYPRPGAAKEINDTLTGTAFLLADSDKVYLVTAKHLVIAKLIGKNQQLANNSIFISASWDNDNKGERLLGLSDWSIQKRPFLFSSDKEDIAIISFQKNKYREILAGILAQKRNPVSVDSIDVSVHHINDPFFLAFNATYINKAGKRAHIQGISPGKIKTYSHTQTTYAIDQYINQGNNGSPLILNDKIIGILSNEDGILTNIDIIRKPFRTARSARVTKASCILPLLRKLQQNENKPGFN